MSKEIVVHQLVRLQLNGTSAGDIQAQAVVSGIEGGSSAIGHLPAPSDVVSQYQDWQLRYLTLSSVSRIIVPISASEHDGLSNRYASSPKDCQQKAQQFLQGFNSWLRTSDFVGVRETLAAAFNQPVSTRFVICTDNDQLQQLPWVLWDFLALYPHIEVAISSQTYRDRPSDHKFPAQNGPVQVLAILGDSANIDIQADQQFLSELPNAEVTFLPTPSRSVLHDQLWERPVDILFFAGHSYSEGSSGTLHINENEALSLEDIQYALNRIARNGLTLAIFNSCDGLGLAKYLSQAIAPTSVPYIIVMREAVPDAVAQAFLKYFLAAFSQGETFHTAVRTARERLENSPDTLPPFGEWMPIIWQNPLAEPPIWPQQQPEASRHKVPLAKGLLTSVGVAAGVVALRFLGALQGLELAAYDRFVRSQPADSVDQNILIVEITEPELDKSEQSSISDATLQELFDRLYQAEPSIVGLDLIRDSPISPEYSRLIDYFGDSDKLITGCGTSASGLDDSELEPSPQANPEGIGLAEYSRDKDSTARRHLLAMDKSVGKCRADFTISTLLAYQYLIKRLPEVENATSTANDWQWGDHDIPLLRSHQGAYHNEDLRGDTTLLNYRITQNLDQPPFQMVTLTEVLSGEVSSDLIKDRIVLIGVTAKSTTDKVKTPFRSATGAHVEIPGVVFQAHQVSHLVDVVLGERRLIRPLPWWADSGWILLWAGIGGVIVGVAASITAGRSPRLRYLIVAGAGVTGTLYIICWSGFVWLGLWLPLVPAMASLIATASLYHVVVMRSSASP